LAAVLVVAIVGGFVGSSLAGGASGFSDVPEDHPFYDQITFMEQTGIAGGFPDGTYRPSQPVTRQAMAAFISRVATYQIGEGAIGAPDVSSLEGDAGCADDFVPVGGAVWADQPDVLVIQSRVNDSRTGWFGRIETDDGSQTNLSMNIQVICARGQLVGPGGG